MKRSDRKKLQRQFKPGDLVTWGLEAKSHVVLEVKPDGVVVDVTGEPNAALFAEARGDGRFALFVAWDENNRSRSGRGPVRLVRRP